MTVIESKSQSAQIGQKTEQLNRYRHEYYNLNAPTISDSEYDRLYDELKRFEQESGCIMSNSPTQTVGYQVVSGLEKVTHTTALLSLDKTKSMENLVSFAAGQAILFMLKLDGLTIKLEYNRGRLIRASTRGDGHTGENVTHNIRGIAGIPETIPYINPLTITGEAFIRTSDFEQLRHILLDSTGRPYKNPRNLAAGAVRCFDAEKCAQRLVRFMPFRVLQGLTEHPELENSKWRQLKYLITLGFELCPSFYLKNYSAAYIEQTVIPTLKNHATVQGIPIDGMVVTFDNIAFSVAQGFTGHHYKDGLAYKSEDDSYETVLRNIEWSPTRDGEISAVGIFDTVEIDGCDVSRATLHNLTVIKELELMIGCRILVSKRNMIIPHIEGNLDRGNYDSSEVIPPTCPCCGAVTQIHQSAPDKEGRIVETLHCENSLCDMQRLRRFEHFVSKKAMDIEGLSEATLERLIGCGWLHNFTDIYSLDQYSDEITAMEGFGVKSWSRLWDSIQRSKNTTFERYLVAMDIPMIGRTASKSLYGTFSGSLEAFEDAVKSAFDFRQLPDFGETKHENIYEWFSKAENLFLWNGLQQIVTIERKEIDMNAVHSSSLFAGMTLVVTGKVEPYTRDGINAMIESLGAKASKAVSKNTDYLICGEKAGSKLEKAQELGVAVLSPMEFFEMAEG